MNDKDKILAALIENKESLYSRYPIRSMAIFGSFSRDEASKGSDVDIMVDLSGKIGIRFIDLAEEIEAILNQRVDIVSRDAIKPKYFNAIKKDLIYV